MAKVPEGWPINALAGRLYYHRRGAGRFGGAFDAVSLAGMSTLVLVSRAQTQQARFGKDREM